MAVTLGINAGFVTEAPVADPGGSNQTVDGYRFATKDTSPAELTKITEIGWWCDNATQETNFEVGLYVHDAENDEPSTRLFVDNTNAKGTDAGWKTVAVDWTITPETIYWIAVQVDNVATATKIDYNPTASSGRYAVQSGINLPDPFTSGSEVSWAMAIYALVEAGGGDGILAPNYYYTHLLMGKE